MRRSPRRREAFGGKVLPVPAPVLGLVSLVSGLAPLVFGGSLLVPSPASAAGAAPAAEPASNVNSPAITVKEEVTVTDTRLYDEPDDRRRVPAHVTVITRDEIESSGARTLQDLLSLEAGVVMVDDIGNDIQKSLDLRGFAAERDQSAIRIYLDGAPLNEPRNNGLQLELVPLSALDRVEITRGSVGALAGGGSEAGVINLWTRRGDGSGGTISGGTGDFGTQEARASAWHDFGAADFFGSGAWEETDGFRENSGGDLERFQGSLGWDLGPERRLSLSALRGKADLGSPGALTLAEFEQDPEQAPFNQLDFLDEDITQPTLIFTTTLGRATSLTANLFAHDRDADTLTTGRAAPVFGGFASHSETSDAGSTAQISSGQAAGGGANRWVAGVEWLDGDNDTRGISTSPTDPGTVDPAGLSSDNTAQREAWGLYLHDTWQPAGDWTIALGARYDDTQVGYDERFPDGANDDQRDFSELSLRGGITWSATPTASLYVSYGEAFLPPTVEQLYSFPQFGSNPGLDPEDSQSYEVGYRGTFSGLDLDAVLFRIDSENEIVFDPFSPLGLFGANVNAGAARRDGIELALRGRAGRSVRPFATLTLLDAELRHGENAGNRLPLAPEERATAGVDLDLSTTLALRAEGIYVGDQVLQNDEANQQRKLDSYDVVNLRATWRPGARRAGGGRVRGLLVYAEARNVLDEKYATRGIYAFDFSTFVNDVFVTPAPGRRYLGGVGWEF